MIAATHGTEHPLVGQVRDLVLEAGGQVEKFNQDS